MKRTIYITLWPKIFVHEKATFNSNELQFLNRGFCVLYEFCKLFFCWSLICFEDYTYIIAYENNYFYYFVTKNLVHEKATFNSNESQFLNRDFCVLYEFCKAIFLRICSLLRRLWFNFFRYIKTTKLGWKNVYSLLRISMSIIFSDLRRACLKGHNWIDFWLKIVNMQYLQDCKYAIFTKFWIHQCLKPVKY